MSQVRRFPALVAAVAAALAAAPAVAADAAALPPELKRVPRDAALFVHADVAAVWGSKIGDTFRSIKLKELEQGLKYAHDYSGLTPDDLKTVTAFMPQLKGPGDEQAVAFTVTLGKPLDRAKLVAAMAFNKVKYVEKPDGVFTFDGPRANAKDDPNNKIVVVLADPKRVEVFFGATGKYRGARPDGEAGPLDPAIAAAASGATAVLGVNFANLPDEIRGDEVPPEARPFQPLFRSDVLVGTANLAGDKVNLSVRFRNTEKAKTLDAEKSLAAGVALLQIALGAGIQELEKAKERGRDREGVALLPLARAAAEAAKTARVMVEENDAVATATVPADLPFASAVQEVFGGSGGPRASAARATTQNNLKQIALALHNYHDVHSAFPPSAVLGKKGKPMLSWRVMILPFVEQDALHKKFKLDEPWDSPHNKKVLDETPMPPVFRVTGVTKDGDKVTHFQGFTGGGALFDPVLGTKLQAVTDGTSNTIMVATAAKAVPWTAPEDIPFTDTTDLKSLLLWQDDKGTNVAFADGSVRFIAKTIDATTLKALITKGGGEVTGEIP